MKAKKLARLLIWSFLAYALIAVGILIVRGVPREPGPGESAGRLDDESQSYIADEDARRLEEDRDEDESLTEHK